MDTLNCQNLNQEALELALKICQGFLTVKIDLNVKPTVANTVTKNPSLVPIETPAELINKLSSAGFSLSIESYGLIVYRY